MAAAVGQLTCTVRVAFGQGLLEHLGGDGGEQAATPGPGDRRATELFDKCRSLLEAGMEDLRLGWHWSDREVSELRAQLTALVGQGLGRTRGSTGGGSIEGQAGGGQMGPLASQRCLFFMALSSGWEWRAAVRDFGDLGPGLFSCDGRSFYPARRSQHREEEKVPAEEQGSWRLGLDASQDQYDVEVGARGVERVKAA